MKKVNKIILGTACSLGMILSLPVQAKDFSGKTIEWIVPFGNGGGTDRWARFNAPLLSKHLPGNPKVVVINQPGGGSTKGANLFAKRAKPNGLTILGTSSSTQIPYLLKDPRVKYEYKDWNVVMATGTGGVVYVSGNLGIKKAQDLKNFSGKFTYGGQRPASLDVVPIVAFKLLGLDVKHVFGFKGRGGARLAFERGETTIDFQATSSFKKKVKPMVDSGKAVPLFTWGWIGEDGKLIRDPSNPNLPHFGEVYEMIHGKKPSGKDYQAYLAFFTAGFPAAKLVVLPKGTKSDIIKTYQNAFRSMFKDPEYKTKSIKVLGTYKQVTGVEAKKRMKKAITVPNSLKVSVKEMLKKDFGAKF